MKWMVAYKRNGVFLFHLFGYGIYIKDSRKARLYFSQRNQITGKLIGPYYIEFIKPLNLSPKK